MTDEKIIYAALGGISIGSVLFFLVRTFTVNYFSSLTDRFRQIEQQRKEERELYNRCAERIKNDIKSLYDRTDRIEVIERDLSLLRKELERPLPTLPRRGGQD